MVTAKAAAIFVEEYGILLELSGANPFRVRAYTNAVRALEALDFEIDEEVQSRLEALHRQYLVPAP